MQQPLIGVTPLMDLQRDSLWMLPGYMEGLSQAGGLPLMLPLVNASQDLERLADTMDGFLFTGGQDVCPGTCGETALPVCGETAPARDAMERRLLEFALARGKPVFGICRGMQFINAAPGGTLWQDLPSQRPGRVDHRQKPPCDRPAHAVNLCRNSPLRQMPGTDRLMVNSCHHQAVRDLADDLEVMAWSEDGLVEAVHLPSCPFLRAVQWHPEFSWKVDPASRALFARFIAASRA